MQDVINVRPQRCQMDGARCAIGGDARQFDPQMRQRGQRINPRRPVGKAAASNVGHAAMIQHQNLIIAGPRQIGSNRQLPCQKTQIKRQPGLADLAQIAAEHRALRHIIRHHMQDAAKALHLQTGAFRQPSVKPCIGFRAARGDLAQHAALPDQPGDKARLGLVIAVIHPGFHEHRPRNALARRQRGIICGGKIPGGQSGNILRPAIAAAVAVDQVLMSVDELHGCS
ncbi:MAG: hypothetical protein ACD_54C00303G0002 [uncultured bacterium]|nr:MAG: hypothetical protein ACD_54C00303G0002 [uncultured bacterium]